MNEDQIYSYSAAVTYPNKYALKTFLENFILSHVRFCLPGVSGDTKRALLMESMHFKSYILFFEKMAH